LWVSLVAVVSGIWYIDFYQVAFTFVVPGAKEELLEDGLFLSRH